MNTMIAEQNKQINISENNKVNQIIRAKEKDFTSNRLDNSKEHYERTLKNNENNMDDKANNDIVEKKENVWIVSKNMCQ